MVQVELAEVVAANQRLRATRSRLEKRTILVDVLRAAGSELGLVTAYLAGTLPQRRTGVGWASLRQLPQPATVATLTVGEVDRLLEQCARLAGGGSAGRRQELLAELFGRTTATEASFLRDLILGELRQGASESAVLDAVAEAFDAPVTLVRRAAMLGGSAADVAIAAASGGATALASFQLEVGRPVRPMLAGSAPDVSAAHDGFDEAETLWDAKLDGVRAQVHRQGDRVWIFTRGMEEITDRLPEVVEQARALPASEIVLDGEVLLMGADGRPRPFQETSARTASSRDRARVRFYAFDLLHIDQQVLLDEPLARRRALLREVMSADDLVQHVVQPTRPEAERFFETLVEEGFEGVVVKSLDAPYTAGRRGSAWVKVKPHHTLDLAVIAVEWGSGRRRGKLSNIHLAARGEGGDLVMVGKTFKGMTDEMLAWQTERFLALETHREGHVVHLRPEQVVEVAIDGVQRSSRYSGGVALRFARVVRYREDKSVAEIDTLDTVREVAGGAGAAAP